MRCKSKAQATLFSGIVTAMWCVILLQAVSCNRAADPRLEAYEYPIVDTSRSGVMHFNLKLSESALAQKLNAQLDKHLLNDIKLQDDFLENATLSLDKVGDALVECNGDVMALGIPTLAQLHGEAVVKLLGTKLSQEVKVNLKAMIWIDLKLGVNQDWRLNSKSSLKSLEWLEEPWIKLGGLKISSAKLIEKKLTAQLPDLLKRLDEKVIPSISLRKTVEPIWRASQQNLPLKLDYFQLNMQHTPSKVFLGKIYGDGQYLNLHLGITQQLSFTLANHQKSVSALPNLELKKDLGNRFSLNPWAILPYKEINAALQVQLLQKVIEVEGNKLMVAAAECFGAGDKLGLYLKFEGDVEGEFYLKGRPAFDTLRQLFYVEDLDFMLLNEDLSVTIASWFYSEQTLALLAEQFKIPLSTKIAVLPAVIENAIERSKMGEKLTLKVAEMSIKITEITPTQNHLFIFATSTGIAELEVDKL